jgi:hypothetical protein
VVISWTLCGLAVRWRSELVTFIMF